MIDENDRGKIVCKDNRQGFSVCFSPVRDLANVTEQDAETGACYRPPVKYSYLNSEWLSHGGMLLNIQSLKLSAQFAGYPASPLFVSYVLTVLSYLNNMIYLQKHTALFWDLT